MYELRDYQKEASDAAVHFFSSPAKGNAIMVLPTGSGKSLVIADIAYRLGEPLVIFQPSAEILEQNFGKLQSYGVLDCSIFSASFNSKRISRITFATIGSVRTTSIFLPGSVMPLLTNVTMSMRKKGCMLILSKLSNARL